MSEAADSIPPLAPGQRLAGARQAQNLAPADIARQLKLSVWQVEALEAGNYAQLPGQIFVRGFIRNYARLVKLNPNELLNAAAEALPQDAPRRETPPSPEIPFPGNTPSKWPLFGAAAAVIVGVLVAYEFYWNEPEPRAVAVTRSEKAETSPSPAQVAVAPVQPATVPAAPAQAGKAEPEASAPPIANAAASPADTERQLKRGERRVKLAFEQESWVEIRDRNERIIFSQLNRPGTQQLVQGVPPFSVVVGNAQGVRMIYEDRQVDLAPHTKIDVARLILE